MCRSSDSSAAETFFGRAFIAAGLDYGSLDNEALIVRCPWSSSNTTGFDGDSSTVIFPATTASEWGLFHCSHAHCARRETIELLDVLPPEALERAREEHGGGFARMRIGGGFLEHRAAQEDLAELRRLVLRCYPEGGGRPFIWMVQLGSRVHLDGLGGLPLAKLLRQRVDLSFQGRDVTWGRLSGQETLVPRRRARS